jgi:sec-independent protein translocase protein TatC
MTSEEKRMSMLGHLDELRSRLVKGSVALMIGAIVAWTWRSQLLDLLRDPFLEAFPGETLQTITPTEQFGSAMRLAGFGGFLLASPVVMWQVWGFVSPGLTSKERRWAVPIVSALVTLFLAGVGFAYLILPRSLLFLNGVLNTDLSLTVSEYLSFVVRFLLVFGLAFEYPVFLFAAGAVGLVTSAQLSHVRRWAVLAISVVAAGATPTGDPFTMLLLAVPLYLMYEITLLLIKHILRK